MKQRIIMVLLMLGWLATETFADITITAIYTEKGDEVRKTEDFDGEAPLQVRFEAEVTDIDPGWTLEWRFSHEGASGSSSLTRYEESPEYTFMDAGKTTVTVYVSLQNEYVDSAKIGVTIYDSILEMPNAFTPNGDGINDMFTPFMPYSGVTKIEMEIYDRWGKRVFRTKDPDIQWDGTDETTHLPTPDGVYYYGCKLYVNTLAGEIYYLLNGSITLIR